MKKTGLIVFGIMICSIVFSQKVYRKVEWNINETKTSGSPITRLEGENKVSMVTNIGYQSQTQLITELKEKKKLGKVAGDKYKAQLNEYKNIRQGGMVYLYLQRPNFEQSNSKNFKIKLIDESGNLIQEKQMRTQDGKATKDGKAYRNDGTVFVKKPITSSFFVEVIEQTSAGEKTVKFKVIVDTK